MIRITGGEFRGRSLRTPHHQHTRPTQAKLRQAWLNSIQTSISDSGILDLFSGSGAMGFEALSRGARHVVFVESSRPTAKIIEENALTLNVREQCSIIVSDVFNCWVQAERNAPFDLVFADPPYHVGFEERLLHEVSWGKILRPEGLFCVEWGRRKGGKESLPEKLPFLVKVREKNYGESVLTTFQGVQT